MSVNTVGQLQTTSSRFFKVTGLGIGSAPSTHSPALRSVGVGLVGSLQRMISFPQTDSASVSVNVWLQPHPGQFS